jgi:hypothetical protein
MLRGFSHSLDPSLSFEAMMESTSMTASEPTP